MTERQPYRVHPGWHIDETYLRSTKAHWYRNNNAFANNIIGAICGFQSTNTDLVPDFEAVRCRHCEKIVTKENV